MPGEANQSELMEMIIKNIAITKLMVMSKRGASTSHISILSRLPRGE
jgi:hypothetical protein